jgi:hypothetical protein
MKTSPFGLGSAKRSRWSASSGTMSAGKATVRVPARDFGSPSISRPSSISDVEAFTRTSHASRLSWARRRPASSPKRRLANIARSSSARYRSGMAGTVRDVQLEPRRLDRRLGDTLEAQVEHRSAVDGEPGLEVIWFVDHPLAADHRTTTGADAVAVTVPEQVAALVGNCS